jgi:hypothetical protein
MYIDNYVMEFDTGFVCESLLNQCETTFINCAGPLVCVTHLLTLTGVSDENDEEPAVGMQPLYNLKHITNNHNIIDSAHYVSL